MLKRFLTIRVLSCLLGAGCSSFMAAAQEQRSAAEDLNGRPINPWRTSQGRVVVLLFVRTDCPIANRYAPAIARLREEFRGKTDFWLVYPDPKETSDRIRAHLSAFRLAMPALRDVRHTLVERSRATITPEAAVFDGAGQLIYHGRIDNWYEDYGRSRPKPTTHELQDAIRAALDGRPAVPEHANAVGCYIADL